MVNLYTDVMKLSVETFVSDIALLDKKLEELNKKWINSPNATVRANSEIYYKSGMLKQAYSDSSEWKKIYNEGKKTVDKKIIASLSTLGEKGGISEKTVKRLAEENNLSFEYVKREADKKGIEIYTSDEKPKEKKKNKSNKQLSDYKPVSIRNYKSNETNLMVVSCKDYFDFLNKYSAKTGKKGSFSAFTEEGKLKSAAKEIKKAWEHAAKNQEQEAVDQLTTAIGLLDKEDYIKYSEYQKLEEITNEINKTFSLIENANEKVLNTGTKGKYINRITEVLSNRDDAESVLLNFCKDKGIKIAEDIPNTVVCPFCSNIFEKVGKTPDKCPSCGRDLIMVCPKCGTKTNYVNSRVCENTDCSFGFDIYYTVESMCKKAQESVNRYDLEFARLQIEEIERIWKGWPALAPIRTQLTGAQNIIGDSVEKLNKFVEENKFFTAKTELEKIRRRIPSYSNEALVSLIEDRISRAKLAWNNAQKQTNIQEKIKILFSVKQLTTDYPGLEEELNKIPPAPIKDFKYNFSESNGEVSLSWNSDDSEGSCDYILIRKEGGFPVSYSDGTQIYKGVEKGFTDKKLNAGNLYYYGIFSQRGSKSVLLTTKEPIVVFPKIKSFDATPSETSLSISYIADKGKARTEIYRCDAPNIRNYGVGVPINETGKNSFSDSHLEKKKKYFYNVFFILEDGGKKYISPPWNVSGETIAFSKPVAYELEKGEEAGLFIVRVTEGLENEGEVKFFSSASDTVVPGSRADMAMLSNMGLNALNVVPIKKGEYSFRLREGEAKYIYAVNIDSGYASIWQKEYVKYVKPVNTKNMRTDGVNLYFELDPWPEDADMLYIVCSNVKPPTSYDEDGCYSYKLFKKAYMTLGYVEIKSIAPMNYYIAGFTRFDDVPIFTTAYCNAKKIEIKYFFTKDFFGSYKIHLELSEDAPIPEMEVRYSPSVPPVYENTGSLFCTIGPTKENFKSKNFEVKGQKLTSGLKGKLFIKNSYDKGRYVALLKEGCSPDLTGKK
ncbi:MAG: hypothetical protein IJS61_00495 [Firmicutes bacterium]|nr:hypothetical protein [Bacillota bacterium]